MRYLTLAADWGAVSLRDEAAGPQGTSELGLPDDLVSDLATWNERYQTVIPADLDERQADPMASLIGELDEAGIELAERIARVLEDGTKVRYYSEGLLRAVP